MPIIKYENVDIHIDSKIILEDVTFTLNAGDFAYIYEDPVEALPGAEILNDYDTNTFTPSSG